MKAKSYWGWIELQGSRVLVHPNFKRGDTKSIPLSSVSSVYFKPAGFFGRGFLEVVPAGHVQEDTWLRRAKHSTRIEFGLGSNGEFRRMRDAINDALDKQAAPAHAASVADELSKLDALRAKGTLTDQEFQSLKQRLLAT